MAERNRNESTSPLLNVGGDQTDKRGMFGVFRASVFAGKVNYVTIVNEMHLKQKKQRTKTRKG